MRLNSRDLLFCIFVVVIAITGCMGGGGGGTPVPSNPADVAEITNTVQSFANALVSKDQAALSSLVSSTCSETECYYTLVVYDFGPDIASSTDNATWSFSINSSEIKQFGDYAEVIARYDHVEPKITMYFNLVKENGKWIIDKLDLGGVIPTSTSTYTHIDTGTYTYTSTSTSTSTSTNTGTTADSIKLFDYLPMDSGNEYWFQTYVNQAIQSNDRKRLYRPTISQSVTSIAMMDYLSTTYSNESQYTANFFNPIATATKDSFGMDASRNFCYYSDTPFFSGNNYLAMFPEYINLPNASYTLATFSRRIGTDDISFVVKLSRSSDSYTYLGQTFTDTLQVTISRFVNGASTGGFVTLLAKSFGPVHRTEYQGGGSIYLENRIIYANVKGVTYGTPPPELSSTLAVSKK